MGVGAPGPELRPLRAGHSSQRPTFRIWEEPTGGEGGDLRPHLSLATAPHGARLFFWGDGEHTAVRTRRTEILMLGHAVVLTSWTGEDSQLILKS